MSKPLFPIGLASAALLLLAASASRAQSSAYFQTVTNLHPVAYWPLQETNPPPTADVETNLGSLGAVANAYYNDSSAVQPGAPGAIVSEPSDGAVSFNAAAAGGFLAVPTTDNRVSVPVGPFTVEAWVRPADYSNYVAMVSQAGPNPGGPSGSTSRGGWVLSQNYQAYADSNGLTGWSFHVYNNQGAPSGQPQGGAEAGVPFNYQLNTWYHLVGVFDGINCTLYVNGTNETSAGYQIPMTGSYVPDTWDPLCIGCGRGLNDNRFGGSIDEVAIYTNALTAAQVLNHYNAGVSASPGTPYETVVEDDQPCMYWRMDAPVYTTPASSTYPVATNYGSLSDVNGLYYPGTLPGMPGPFGPSSLACAINGLDAGIVVGSSPVDPVLNPINSPVTVMLWFKSNPADARFQVLAGHGDIGSHSWRVALDAQGYLRWNGGEDVIYSTTPTYNDGNWHFVVASYVNRGTTATGTNFLYVDGVLETNDPATGSNTGDAGNPILGGDPDSENTGPSGYSQAYAAVQIAQMAVFTNGLSAAQVQSLYAPAGMPPFILTQPTTGRVEPSSLNLNFGVRASGAGPLSYQWYYNTSSSYSGATELSDGAKYAGSATTQLTVSNLVSGDNGYYFVVITNNYGSVTSEPASLQVGSSPYYLVPAIVGFSLTNQGLVLNPAFCGLSYDKSQLTGSLFLTNDTAMIQMFSQIAPAVLRVGADSVDTTCWGGLSNLTPITASEVDAFAGFVKALPTNWSIIYGINMSVNNPTNCAAEAAYAANDLGSSLLGFEIGNEPDEYANNGIRASTFTYAQFLSQWQALAAAITNTVPGWAITNGGNGWTLTGPVSAVNTAGYTVPFVGDEAGVISMVTQHYYLAGGASTNSTMALLLSPDMSLPGTVNTIASAASAAGLPLGYRTDECNSFYGGGAPNVSDAYGTALWALDFMFTSAINGCQGVNFHGGGDGTGYTPIADNGTTVVQARPVFYGLKMFSLLPRGRVLPAVVSLGSSINFTAYGVREDSGATCAVLNNKETNDAVQVSINLGAIVTAAQMIELTGTNLAATNGCTIGGATINPDGSWTGGVQSVLPATNGQLTITVPPISAILLSPVAPTVYWTGASSADWTDSGNWQSNTVPSSVSDVVFSFPSVANFSTILGQNTTVNSLAIQETGPISISGNSLTINSGGIDMLSASNNATINSALVLGASQSWAIAPNRVLTIAGPMSGAGDLTLWQGTVILAGTNSCTGTTTITNGTLEVNGSMSNPIAVTGGTLTGTGVLSGPVTVGTGGTISPGPGIAELFVSNTLAAGSGGSISMDVNASTGASDEIAGVTQLTYGGTLVLNNQAGSFSATNTFKLFNASAYAGAFSSISPALPGTGLDWDTNTLATDGTLRIINGVIPTTTNVVESRFGNSTSGSDNPAFSFNGFSSTISATKSSAPGCSSPGSSRFSNTASTSTRFSVTPSLLAGTTYSVSVTWGFNDDPYEETPSIVVSPTATGVSSSTFPATTTVFSSGSGDATYNTWETVGSITPNVNNPVITFTYVSGLSSGRWYADAVRFISQPPNPGAMTASQTGGEIILNWQGNFILQSATNVLGPYTDVLGPVVTGPYTNTMGPTQQFFRLRQ